MLKHVLLFLVLPTLCFAQQTTREIASRAFASTVLISVDDANGQPLAIGSGFVIKPGVVATNYHVIEGASGGFVKLTNTKAKHEITGIIALSEKYDLAILSVPSLSAPAMQLGNFSSVAIGDAVYVVGNPKGLEGTFSQGIVSGIRNLETDRLLQITAPISPGSSGGPVLDGQGKVIGVSVATFRGGQNLNFAIPVTYLSTLAANSSSNPAPFKRVKRTDAKASIINSIGDGLKDGVTGVQFAWTYLSEVSYERGRPYMGYYTFSVRNNLRESIKNIVCAVIFYGNDNLPIETEIIRIWGPVAPKLAKRSEREGRRETSISALTKSVEIRILDFEIIDE